MFSFFLKRYLYKISSQRGLFILALIPAFMYLAAAAAKMDRFKIYQAIKIAPDIPLALSNSPSDVTSIDWFVAHQDELFLDGYTLQTLGRELQKELPPQPAIMTEPQLMQVIKNAMSLSYEKGMLRISYSGVNQGMGEFLAAFYAKKIVKKAEEGVRRQEMLPARQVQQQEGIVSPIPKSPPYSELKGGLTVESEKALWRSERLPITVLLLAAGLAAVLVWIGILELLDNSFKSERQIARILRLPVLGTVPNVFTLSKVIGAERKKNT
jgi:hypothetical protein